MRWRRFAIRSSVAAAQIASNSSRVEVALDLVPVAARPGLDRETCRSSMRRTRTEAGPVVRYACSIRLGSGSGSGSGRPGTVARARSSLSRSHFAAGHVHARPASGDQQAQGAAALGAAVAVAVDHGAQVDVDQIGERRDPRQHVAELVLDLGPRALAERLRQLAGLLRQPRDGAGHAARAVAVAIRALDDVAAARPGSRHGTVPLAVVTVTVTRVEVALVWSPRRPRAPSTTPGGRRWRPGANRSTVRPTSCALRAASRARCRLRHWPASGSSWPARDRRGRRRPRRTDARRRPPQGSRSDMGHRRPGRCRARPPFDVVVMPGNVMIFVTPGTERRSSPTWRATSSRGAR